MPPVPRFEVRLVRLILFDETERKSEQIILTPGGSKVLGVEVIQTVDTNAYLVLLQQMNPEATVEGYARVQHVRFVCNGGSAEHVTTSRYLTTLHGWPRQMAHVFVASS